MEPTFDPVTLREHLLSGFSEIPKTARQLHYALLGYCPATDYSNLGLFRTPVPKLGN